MVDSAHFSQIVPVFHGRIIPNQNIIVGYAAIIHALNLPIPMPSRIALVGKQNKKEQSEEWYLLPKSYLPEDNGCLFDSLDSEIAALYNHLVFALKYEGLNLLVFSALTKYYDTSALSLLVAIKPTGQYSRRIWFIIEWITGDQLPEKENLSKKSYIPLLDETIQYTISGTKSPRHLIINNLPGTRDFCPLIYRTDKLENYISSTLSDGSGTFLQGIHKDILQRASAFLLLKDSKASFTIEGESPKSKRAIRWSQAIGQAGSKELNREELLRLQQVVIENTRFVAMGFREKGGFIGEHDRDSGTPIPEHISSRWQDVERLTTGLLETNQLLLNNEIDPILAATIIAFGFVFIHPFEDGNGRIHRYLIHHLLAKKKFAQQGVVFPVSASILDHIDDYREVLEHYSHPLLDHIEWQETKDHNIEVLNETIDYYRYFDATKQAEFLYDCVDDTIQNIIPKEVEYLRQYDLFKRFLDDEFEMPDKMVALLVRFLEQHDGKLSKRAREKEFPQLTETEIKLIEAEYEETINEVI